MKAKGKELICEEIENFKAEQGDDYSDYYIGITNEPQRRLIENLEEHISSGILGGDIFYVANAGSNKFAVEIEIEFQKKGMKEYNPESKGKELSTYVYCFKIAKDEVNDAEKKVLRKMVRKELGKLWESLATREEIKKTKFTHVLSFYYLESNLTFKLFQSFFVNL